MIRHTCQALLLAAALLPHAANGQQHKLTIEEVRSLAEIRNPSIVAAREAVAGAAGRAQQAAAFPNPSVTYGREQTSRGDISASQNIVALEQRLEIGGQRAARREAAALRQQAAEARLAGSIAELRHKVTNAYSAAVASDRTVQLASAAADAFARARIISDQRLQTGDVSGYTARRVRLEAARYAGLRAEAMLLRRRNYSNLATQLGMPIDSLLRANLTPPTALPIPAVADSIASLTLSRYPELRAAELEASASAWDARLARRERIPNPLASAGYKEERSGARSESLRGFVAGISLAVPLWDRHAGGMAAADADARGRVAQVAAMRIQAVSDALQTLEAVHTSDEQLELLRTQLGREGEAALRAAQSAYAEGEITLIEWLDAMRAYQEAETSFANITAESIAQRATLERATGLTLVR